MPIQNGWYDQATRKDLLHQGRPYTPTSICIHYTVTDTVDAAISALNSRKLSYHLLVDHDGSVTQTRPVDLHAAHGGYANWKETGDLSNGTSLNERAVSISLINRGFFAKTSGDVAYDVNAHGDPVGKMYPLDQVQRTGSVYHPNGLRNWHKYTAAQIQSVDALIGDLCAAYPAITELAGHDDISNNAKFDPGPLMPMDKFRSDHGLEGTLGFETQVSSPDGELNLRQRPTGGSTKLATLHNGDELFIRSVVYTTRPGSAIWMDRKRYRYLTPWASVDTNGTGKHAGFVHMKYLADTPLAAAYQDRL